MPFSTETIQAGGDMAESTEEIRKHVKIYIAVFAALLFLTVVTVAISYLHLSTLPAVLLAMAVALVKGSLVALFFMHLSDEKKIIYRTLTLTGVLFIVLMAVGFML